MKKIKIYWQDLTEKAKELHDKAAEDLAKANPPEPKNIKKTGKGNDLFYETRTGQWIESDYNAVLNDAVIFMVYRGYRIVPRKHPTPMDENKRGYDIDAPNGRLMEANFAELAHCKQMIDQMIKLKRWPKYC